MSGCNSPVETIAMPTPGKTVGRAARYIRAKLPGTRTLFRSASGGESAVFGDQYCVEAIDKAVSPNAEGKTSEDNCENN